MAIQVYFFLSSPLIHIAETHRANSKKRKMKCEGQQTEGKHPQKMKHLYPLTPIQNDENHVQFKFQKRCNSKKT